MADLRHSSVDEAARPPPFDPISHRPDHRREFGDGDCAAARPRHRSLTPTGAGHLTPRQRRFVEEYLLDLNATRAAMRAGYSIKTAQHQGPRLLGYAHVAAAVQAAQQKRSERTAISQDWVLNELRKIATADPRKLYRADGTMKTIPELDDNTAAAVSALDFSVDPGSGQVQIRKLRRGDKLRALELIGRHLGMFAEQSKEQDRQQDSDAWVMEQNQELIRTIRELRKPRAVQLLDAPRGNGSDR